MPETGRLDRRRLLAAVPASLLLFTLQAKASAMHIRRAGSQASVKGPAAWFLSLIHI